MTMKKIFLCVILLIVIVSPGCSSQLDEITNSPASNDYVLDEYHQWRAIGAEINKSALTTVGAIRRYHRCEHLESWR